MTAAPLSVTALIRSIRRLDEYHEWVKAVFIRDRFTCQQCGKRNGRKRIIEAHHLVELSTLVRENNVRSVGDAKDCSNLWGIDNGQTLCHSCHEKTISYPSNFKQKTTKK